MAIKKNYLKNNSHCKVTFSIAAKDAVNVSVIGDFNHWDSKTHPLKKLKNGTFKGIVDLQKGQSYEFRYFIDGEYVNDDEADDFIWNDFAAGENGVLNL